MSMPASRVTDMHVCPMVTGIVPHVGGPVLPPCAVTVLTGKLPQARIGDMCVCVGPPDVIVTGAFTVIVSGSPAARIGDTTVHGGKLVLGWPTVLIGDNGSSSSGGGMAARPPFTFEAPKSYTGAGKEGAQNAQAATLKGAAQGDQPFCEQCR